MSDSQSEEEDEYYPTDRGQLKRRIPHPEECPTDEEDIGDEDTDTSDDDSEDTEDEEYIDARDTEKVRDALASAALSRT